MFVTQYDNWKCVQWFQKVSIRIYGTQHKMIHKNCTCPGNWFLWIWTISIFQWLDNIILTNYNTTFKIFHSKSLQNMAITFRNKINWYQWYRCLSQRRTSLSYLHHFLQLEYYNIHVVSHSCSSRSVVYALYRVSRAGHAICSSLWYTISKSTIIVSLQNKILQNIVIMLDD